MKKEELLKSRGFFKDIKGEFWVKSDESIKDLAERKKTEKIVFQETVDFVSVGKLSKFLKNM